jgi:hypothetical protein
MLRPNSWRGKIFPLILDIVNSLGPVAIELQEAPSWQLHFSCETVEATTMSK